MKPKVVTIGLGYIGLPTSALISSKGTYVLGVDINQKVVDKINMGEIHIAEPDLDKIVSHSVSQGFFRASLKPKSADVYLIVVPTPFKNNYEPDISFVEDATKSIIPLLKENDLYIIESTSPVGTTEKMAKLIFDSRPELREKIHIAYCPERVLPGNIIYELVNNDRVIGGLDKISTEAAIKFYKKFVKGKLHPTNARTAEMCKLVENSSRDVQIAFANELSIICDQAKVNVWELISLANMHPRVNILNPGCGVGGHCIAVDPYFLISEFPNESQIIGKSRQINNYKSEWCEKKIFEEKEKFLLNNNRNPVIALLGLTFKPNIDDIRESPALKIARQIEKNKQRDIEILYVDPNIQSIEGLKLSKLNYAINKSDIIIFLVAHDQFKNLKIENSKIIVDFCNVNQYG